MYDTPGVASDGTINMIGDTLYISLKNYAEYGKLALYKSVENDPWTGTWRLSLSDGSLEKLSDEYYTSLYVFDDTSLYASTPDGDIVILDLDGNRIFTIFDNGAERLDFWSLWDLFP